MKFPIDSYDLKARYTPAAIVATPIVVSLWTCFPVELKDLSAAAGGTLTVIIWYAAAVLVRHCGKKAEPHLWESWGGPPSTTLLLWSNDRLGNELKALYHNLVQEKLALPMPDMEQEAAAPDKAALTISQAFTRVRGVIRKHDPNGLWSKANAEYGFARNLYGSRWIWLISTLGMVATLGYTWWTDRTPPLLLGTAINALMLAMALYWTLYASKDTVEKLAWRYAEAAWESFYNSTKPTKTD